MALIYLNSYIFKTWKENEARWTKESLQHLSTWWNCYWFMTNASRSRRGLVCCCQMRTESRQVLLSIAGRRCQTAAAIIIDLIAPNDLSFSGQSRLWQLNHARHWHKEEVTWALRGKVRWFRGANLPTNSITHKL